MPSNLYQRIWDEDENRATVKSVNRDIPDSELEAGAQVYLDEQVQANGRREIDLATRPLFRHVDPDLLKRPIYAKFIALLDNYIVHFRSEEVSNPSEQLEERDFVDECFALKPFEILYDYVSGELRPGISKDQLRDEVLQMWFERYTNYYRGRSTRFCTGFEHVFVGEGRYNARQGLQETMGEISGYHSWIKFYLDEAAERVNFLGYKYDLRGNQGPDNPNVVTLQMIWNHQDFNGNLVAQLFKRKGGFFVGPSPAAEMAMGTAAFYESAAGLADNDRIPVELGNPGRNFNIVMFRNITEEGRRGRHIRSFYPEYGGGGAINMRTEPQGDRVVVRPVRGYSKNDGDIRIIAAMPNPAGHGDTSGEWVKILNTSEKTITIDNWELRDRMERPMMLSGSLDGGEELQINIIKTANGPQLGNRGGIITIVDDSANLIAQLTYGRAQDGEALEFSSENG